MRYPLTAFRSHCARVVSRATRQRAVLSAWALCFAALLAGSDAFALGNEVAGDHLLRLFDSQQLEDGRLVEDEVLIFRDGVTVLLRTVGRHTRVFRADATVGATEQLKRTLVDAEIDSRLGECDVQGVPRILGGLLGLRSRSTWLSWFGVGGRRARHLALGHEGSSSGQFGTECSESLQRIAGAAFGFAQTALSGPTATSGPDEHYPRSLLYSVRSDLQSDPSCARYAFDEDAYIFRDGLLLHHFLDSDGSFGYTRAQVPQETRRRFNDLLTEARIGSVDAVCRTWFFLPFAVNGACLDYSWQSAATWHGRDERQGTIAGEESVQNRCSSVELRVRMELVRLMLAAVTDTAAVTINGGFETP